MLMLSRLVRDNGFKVVMTGEGADEVFAGYDVFKEAKVRRFCAAQPASKRRPQLLEKLYPYMPRLQGQSQRYLEAFFGGEPGGLDDPLYSHLPRFRSSAGAKAFFSADLRAEIGNYDALADLRERLPADFMRWHPLSQSQYLESAYLLPGYILSSQGDRVGMANAVEGRFPFLDHRVIELAARIPPRLKLKGLTEKHILRQSMKHLLPGGIATRPKQPYRAPESRAFLRSGAAAAVLDHMSRGKHQCGRILRRRVRRPPGAEVLAAPLDRLSRQPRVRRHPFNAGLARDLRQRRHCEPWHSACFPQRETTAQRAADRSRPSLTQTTE